MFFNNKGHMIFANIHCNSRSLFLNNEKGENKMSKIYWKLEAEGKLKTGKACAEVGYADKAKTALKNAGWKVTKISKTAYDKIAG
jgi:hypothetical protein